MTYSRRYSSAVFIFCFFADIHICIRILIYVVNTQYNMKKQICEEGKIAKEKTAKKSRSLT